jgi:hypothetical protein
MLEDITQTLYSQHKSAACARLSSTSLEELGMLKSFAVSLKSIAGGSR